MGEESIESRASEIKAEACALVCCQCGRRYYRRQIACDACATALLRTEYLEKHVVVTGEAAGLRRFSTWLPAGVSERSQAGAAILVAERYGRKLGLKDLSIAFNGYWPERGALNPTNTFKDSEAAPTIAYFRRWNVGRFVLASAGNTARAFAFACSEENYPCLIVIPESAARRLWIPRQTSACVTTVVLAGSDQYYEAIVFSEAIAHRYRLAVEGGARNVARRDGIGTAVIEYAVRRGVMPQHYVQAVGSGAGGIAAYEASLRLRRDGSFGELLPSLHLVQNSPMTAIHDAWTGASPCKTGSASRSRPLYAEVLGHTNPPFEVAGGVRAALTDTSGSTYSVTAAQAMAAKARFEQLEHVSINEAAACACAGLELAVASKRIAPSDRVLLNITGGGEDLVRRDFHMTQIRVDCYARGGTVEDAGLAKILSQV